MPAFHRRPWVWLTAALALTGSGALLLLVPLDRRTAWDQAPLSRGKLREDPVTLSLWANDLDVFEMSWSALRDTREAARTGVPLRKEKKVFKLKK